MSIRSGVVWRLVLVGLVAPVVAYVIAAAWMWPNLPDPIATHWDADGVVNGTMPRVVGAVVFPLGVMIAVGALSLVMPALVPGRAPGRRWAVAMPAGIEWFIGFVMAASLVPQRGVSSAQAAAFSQLWLVPALGLATLMTWLVARGIPVPPAVPRASLPRADAPRLHAAPDEQVWWSGYAVGGPTVRVLGVILIGAAVAAGALGLWIVAVILVGACLLLVALTAFRVVIGQQQLVASSILGWPRLHIPLDTLTQAEVRAVNPLSWGGWGLRYRPGGVGIITRRGPGLRLTLTDESIVALTVEDAQTAAETINTLLDRSAI